MKYKRLEKESYKEKLGEKKRLKMVNVNLSAGKKILNKIKGKRN